MRVPSRSKTCRQLRMSPRVLVAVPNPQGTDVSGGSVQQMLACGPVWLLVWRSGLTGPVGLVGESMVIRGSFMAAAMRQVKMLRHRIVAAGAQRLAAQYAPTRKQTAAPWPESRHGNPCIIGAAGVEAATRSEQRAEPTLVQMEQPQYQSGQNIHEAGQLATSSGTSIPEASLPVQDTWVITPGRHGQ